MKKILLKLAGHGRGIGVAGAFAFVAGALSAGAQDQLRTEVARAADQIAGSLNRLGLLAGSAVSVRPARMELDGIFVDCPALATDLRGHLRDALERERADNGFTFALRAVDGNELAPVEVNTSWRHDERDGRDVLSARVTVTVDRRFVGRSETNWEVDAAELSDGQRKCLMKWTHRERLEVVADGQQVVVRDEPSLRGARLKRYRPGDEVEVVGDLEPLDALDVRDRWQLVWLSERGTYGYAKVGPARADPSPGQPFTVTTVPSGATVRLPGHSEAYRVGMLLVPGRYRVEASAEGYETAMETVAHGAEPTVRRVVLRKAGRVGEKFRDCPDCPEMAVLPAGSFQMGSPSYEQGRADDEGPVHEVTIGAPFALGVYEVTVGEFSRFVDETGYSAGSSCWTYEDGEVNVRTGRSWRDPGFGQSGGHPAACVNWGDARAYAAWLSRRTGESYRLPSESEWEYGARAGTATSRYWGEGESGQCRHANGADASTDFYWRAGCSDGHARTAPAGSFGANEWGLHDMLGNVWEWTEDCWNGSYAGAPSDGSAWLRGDCSGRVVRGGSWDLSPSFLRAAYRFGDPTGLHSSSVGFRVARTLAP